MHRLPPEANALHRISDFKTDFMHMAKEIKWVHYIHHSRPYPSLPLSARSPAGRRERAVGQHGE